MRSYHKRQENRIYESQENRIYRDTEQNDLIIRTTKIRHYTEFEYLSVTFSSNGRSTDDIANKIRRGKCVTKLFTVKQLTYNLTKKIKTTLYMAVAESICTY